MTDRSSLSYRDLVPQILIYRYIGNQKTSRQRGALAPTPPPAVDYDKLSGDHLGTVGGKKRDEFGKDAVFRIHGAGVGASMKGTDILVWKTALDISGGRIDATGSQLLSSEKARIASAGNLVRSVGNCSPTARSLFRGPAHFRTLCACGRPTAIPQIP
ncbi:hypothetical protein JP75_18130 [Devosia riboflavina]|uniref:Uncharacterized protein n=1 Tax=Devosia riboflavina TaxID=46914 RepID=A0A087LZF9_9HYPH|nr:hypothetical protein JP75_18130 [Devosia riboflavina]